MQRVLFVCTGNTCRSPLAEALLKKKRPDLEVKSAGVSAMPGMSASDGTLYVLEEKGIQFQHLSQQINENLMNWADLVLTLTEGHKRLLTSQFPFFVDKIYTLKEFAYQDEYGKIQELLQHHYAELELKKAKFLGENKEIIEQLNEKTDLKSRKMLETLTKEIQQLLENDRKMIEQLEKQLPSINISDPFGGSIKVYKKAAKEIEEAIDQLVKKI